MSALSTGAMTFVGRRRYMYRFPGHRPAVSRIGQGMLLDSDFLIVVRSEGRDGRRT